MEFSGAVPKPHVIARSRLKGGDVAIPCGGATTFNNENVARIRKI